MTDPNIKLATDYLQDLFEKLAAGRQDPARVDWPFAAECRRAVCEEIERLRGEIEQLRRRAEDAEGGEQYVTGLVKEAAEVLGLSPYHGIAHRARAVVEERDRLRGEVEEMREPPSLTVSAAKTIANRYGKEIAIIFHMTGDQIGYVSYGKDRAHCKKARWLADRMFDAAVERRQ